MKPATVFLTFVSFTVAQAAGNLYPDPSFEQSGVPGVARTGEKAGYLAVGDKRHWVTIGGPLAVEPFATYRATAWVRGKIGPDGGALALYCYEWDSYVWAFSTSVGVPHTDEWQPVRVTFRSPYDRIVFHPLAFLDAAHSESWIDDLVIERIRSPEETIRELIGEGPQSLDDVRLLARYYVGQGDLDAALALLKDPHADARVRADIACIVAAKTEDPARRAALLEEMIRSGGPTYNWGDRRLNEMSAGLTPAEVLAAAERAVLSAPDSDLAARSYAAVAGKHLIPAGIGTLREREQQIEQSRASLDRVLEKLPEDSAARKEIFKVAESLQSAQEQLAQEREKLGHCVISIGGQVLDPETHAIVLPAAPTPQERHAARDLAMHLERITGQAFPIVSDEEVGDRTPLVVGKSRLLRDWGLVAERRTEGAEETARLPLNAKLRAHQGKIDFDALGLEGIVIKTVGPALVLTGNKRGVLYATYTFLEDTLGCRWFTPDCETWPTEGRIDVPELDVTYIPPLEYRATDYPNSRPADWAVRNKLNGTQTYLDEERGGKISYAGFVHTFNALVPPERYFNEHPEYFSEINGKRVKDYTQLCLTNPQVLEITIDSVRRWIQDNPTATIVSVSQNDWHNYCTCANCQALAEKEGAQSGPLLHFVNAVAEAIEQDYPHVLIDTLAYQYTRKPPKHVKPRHNVAVRLCSIECAFNRPLETDPFNRSFVEDIRGWNEICDRLHIWDYVIDYSHCVMPFPNLYVLRPNIDFFIRHGVTGIYEEANYFSKGGEFAELRTYVMAKTLWDPTYDTDRAIDEFLAAYYGAAARPIREYINLIHERAQADPDLHMTIWTPPTASYLSADVLGRAEELFDEAERLVADQPQVLHRVQVARLPIMYTRIMQARAPRYQRRGDALVPSAEGDVRGLLKRFEAIARQEGLTHIREGNGLLDDWLASFGEGPQELPFTRLSNEALELLVLPGLGGRLYSLRHRPTDTELLLIAGSPDDLQPEAGGYEEYSTAQYRSPGCQEPYTVTDRTDQALTLEATLRNGLRLSRRIELDPARPLVRITSTLSNPTDAAKTACLRVHPCFQVSDVKAVTVEWPPLAGEKQSVALAEANQGRATGEIWLRGADRPAGAWSLHDGGTGLTLINRFAPDEVGLGYINWSVEEKRVNLELWSPEKRLEPEEGIRIVQEYEILQSE